MTKLYGYVSNMGAPEYDDILNSDLPKEEKVKQIQMRGQAYRDELDRDAWKNYARMGLGTLISGASMHPILNIPYIGTGLGGAMYELGQGMVEGDKLPEILKRTGQGFAIGETVGALPYVGKLAGKTKAGQYVGEQATNLANSLIKNTGTIQPIRTLKRVLSQDISDIKGNPFKTESATLYDILADDMGNPISFYHGTPNGGFTEFRPYSHFTKNPDYAAIYKNPSASSIQVKQTANNPSVYEVNLDINKMFDTRNPFEKNIFKNEYQAYYAPELSEKGLPDWTEAEELAEWLRNKYPEYDGLIVDEGGVGGYGDIVKDRGESYIPFSPEQIHIKNIKSEKPINFEDLSLSNKISNIAENMRKGEYNPLKYKGEAVTINNIEGISKSDMDYLTHELNNNLTSKERTRKIIKRPVGDYVYKVRNKGFNEYEFIEGKPIDDILNN